MDENTKISLTVPGDFPRYAELGCVAGAQAKLVLREVDGKYIAGLSSAELLDRYLQCEKTAGWLSQKCLKNEHGKYAALTRSDILAQYCRRMVATMPEFSLDEIKWIIERCAEITRWPIPENL